MFIVKLGGNSRAQKRKADFLYKPISRNTMVMNILI